MPHKINEDPELLAFVIGYRIRQRRIDIGLSQQQLAHGIGSQSLISLIESGRQLPLPDVLHLLALRLTDETLDSYASAMESGGIYSLDLTVANDEALLTALRAHRGRWQPVHEAIALELCDHYYTNTIFEILTEICQLIVENSKDPRVKGPASFYLGSINLHQFNYLQAEKWLTDAEQSCTLFEPLLAARLQYNLAYTYSALDVQVLALWYIKRAIGTFRDLEDYPMQAYALGLLGLIEHRMQRDTLAKHSLALARDIMERWQTPIESLSRILSTTATVHLGLGEIEAGRQLAEETLELTEQTSDAPSRCVALQCLANIYFQSDEEVTGLRYLERAISEGQRYGDDSILAELYLLAAEHYATSVLRVRAANNALEAAIRGGLSVLEALASEYLANLMFAMGDAEEGQRAQKRALAAYRRHAQRSSMVGELLQFVSYEETR